MAILTVWALLLTASVPVPAAAPVSVRTVATQDVTVKLGQASLEEYTHGDPASRVQLVSVH